jgi:hypothetical protein
VGNKKKNPCIDYDKNTDTYGFVRFNKYFKKGTTIRKSYSSMTEDEKNLLMADFNNHWNALPLGLQNRFIKWLTTQSEILYGKKK